MTESQDRFYEQLVRAGTQRDGAGEGLRRRVMAQAGSVLPGSSEELESTGLAEPTQPSVRLVPDVPTVPADEVLRGTAQIEIPGRRHRRRWTPMPTRFSKWIVRAGLTAAAAGVLVAVLLRGDGGRQSAFAQAIAQVAGANTIVCEMNSPEPVSVMGMQLTATGKLYISAQHGSRYEQYANGMLVSVMLVPPDGKAVNLNVPAKQYLAMDMQKLAADRRRHNPDEFIRGLANQTGRATRDLGTATVGGVQAYGYEIAGAKVDGGATGDRSELWVDPKTSLPVRYVVEMPGFEPGKTMTVVYENFALDVPLDPSLFDTALPEGYTRVDVTMPNPDENTLINALRQYSNITGDYPSVLSMPRVVGGLMMAGLRGAKQPDGQVSLEIGAGVVFYAELQGKGVSPEYFGNKVKPGQQDAVLVRWKTDGGKWRVIYGDLRIDTMEADPTPRAK